MSDWKKLNAARVRQGMFATTDADGFNGAFCMMLNGLKVKCIASDGGGWQHVSVSIHDSSLPPSWSVMCQVKDLFWEEEDCVVQFHPPKSAYVNNHAGCLHLWRCTDGREFPRPPEIMVGIKELGDTTHRPDLAAEALGKAITIAKDMNL
jgi:hypothetical protein